MADEEIVIHFEENDRIFLLKILNFLWLPRLRDMERGICSLRFEQWKEFSEQRGRELEALEERNKLIHTLMTSKRGDRTIKEKEIIYKCITQNLTCIPKNMSKSDMDALCNELDWHPVIGKSILFLQGDFGNCYYMVAVGRVGLYLETSKDREMIIAREYGKCRGVPFEGTVEDLDALGRNIYTVPTGGGFGEYAILSATQKLRSCTAAAIDDDCILFIMHAETYNKVLRHHHYRQRALNAAKQLLQEIPVFAQFTFTKLAQVAYTMTSQIYSSNSQVINYGDPIKNIYVIGSGQVKVFPPHSKTESSVSNPRIQDQVSLTIKRMEKRLPKLAVALLGKGSVIGELEISKKMSNFENRYVASSGGCEVFLLPLHVYHECIASGKARDESFMQELEEYNNNRDKENKERMGRTRKSMKEMMISPSAHCEATKRELMSVLPTMVDESPFHFSEPYPEEDGYNNRYKMSSGVNSSISGGGSLGYTHPLADSMANLLGSVSFNPSINFNSTQGSIKNDVPETLHLSLDMNKSTHISLLQQQQQQLHHSSYLPSPVSSPARSSNIASKMLDEPSLSPTPSLSPPLSPFNSTGKGVPHSPITHVTTPTSAKPSGKRPVKLVYHPLLD